MKYERHCQWYTNKETLIFGREMRVMKLFNTLVVLMLTPALIFAYEEKCMPNLVVPTVLESKSLEVGIVHRFLRNPTATFPDNFINMANVELTARVLIFHSSALSTHSSYAPILQRRIGGIPSGMEQQYALSD